MGWTSWAGMGVVVIVEGKVVAMLEGWRDAGREINW